MEDTTGKQQRKHKGRIYTDTNNLRKIIIKERGSHVMISNPSQRLSETGSFLHSMTTFSRIIIKFPKD